MEIMLDFSSMVVLFCLQKGLPQKYGHNLIGWYLVESAHYTVGSKSFQTHTRCLVRSEVREIMNGVGREIRNNRLLLLNNIVKFIQY